MKKIGVFLLALLLLVPVAVFSGCEYENKPKNIYKQHISRRTNTTALIPNTLPMKKRAPLSPSVLISNIGTIRDRIPKQQFGPAV